MQVIHTKTDERNYWIVQPKKGRRNSCADDAQSYKIQVENPPF